MKIGMFRLLKNIQAKSENSSIDSFATFLFVHFLGEASHQEIRISLKYEESALDPLTSDGYFHFLNFLEKSNLQGPHHIKLV